MNKKQKIISVIGVILIFLTGFIPPWKVTTNDPRYYSERPIGHYIIFLPPELVQDLVNDEAETDTEVTADPEPEEEIPHSIEVDTTRLIIQWVTILFVLAAALFITKEKEEEFDEDYDE